MAFSSESPSTTNADVIVIGAGPSGLAAAWKLVQKGKRVLVLEADPEYVGGIARTVVKNGYRFDVGGHRFFSKSAEVNKFWNTVLPNDFLLRARSSRIYYRGKYFAYPLRPLQAFFSLGFKTSAQCIGSFFVAKTFPHKHPHSFQQWVRNQFGNRLFEIFFKTYTEKVWGIPCTELSADWAAQRITGLSLWKMFTNGLARSFSKNPPKSLTKQFHYPRLGPGMMWEECAKQILARGGNIVMGAQVTSSHNIEGEWQVTYEVQTNDGKVQKSARAMDLVSSAPLAQFIPALKNELSPQTKQAALGLRYRNFITVVLIVAGDCALEDQWIYIHDPGLKVGRIQNFRAWSPELIPIADHQSFGLEFFCWEDDEFWRLGDETLIALARKEFAQVGLMPHARFVEAHVVRQPKAYPVYDEGYEAKVSAIRTEMEKRFTGFHFVGRNGMHRYNNQDHAVMTGMLAADNICARSRVFDPWQVNQDAEYLESAHSLQNSERFAATL